MLLSGCIWEVEDKFARDSNILLGGKYVFWVNTCLSLLLMLLSTMDHPHNTRLWGDTSDTALEIINGILMWSILCWMWRIFYVQAYCIRNFRAKLTKCEASSTTEQYWIGAFGMILLILTVTEVSTRTLHNVSSHSL
jgi:heme/copper-type cytochrome/quinol oxidase subunit 2